MGLTADPGDPLQHQKVSSIPMETRPGDISLLGLSLPFLIPTIIPRLLSQTIDRSSSKEI